jgi:hypothetical protein
MMHRAVRRFARLEIELAEQSTEADPRALVPDADSDRAILIMDAHRDHGALESRVGHARHRQEELAREEGWLIGHKSDNERRSRDEQGLRALYGGPICRSNAT